MKIKIEHGCTRIHSGVERLGLRFRGRKEDNKQVLIVRDNRECYRFGKSNEFGESHRYKK